MTLLSPNPHSSRIKHSVRDAPKPHKLRQLSPCTNEAAFLLNLLGGGSRASETLQTRGVAVAMGTGLETELNRLGYLGEGVTTKHRVRSRWLASADMLFLQSMSARQNQAPE